MKNLQDSQAGAATQIEYTESADWAHWAPWTSTRKTTWHRVLPGATPITMFNHQGCKTLCGLVIPAHAIVFAGCVESSQECKCCRDVQRRRQARERAMATGKRYLTHRERVSLDDEYRYYL